MKNIKLILLNIFSILIIYLCAEIILFCIETKKSYQCDEEKETYIQYTINTGKVFFKKYFSSFDDEYKKIVFRPISGTEYKKKKPLVIFGCSFAYGSDLDDDKTFSSKLSKFTHRKVYNRAYYAWGPQNMLYQLRRDDLYNVIKEEPEAIIYVYMDGHVYRIYREVWKYNTQIFYKKTKNGLKEEKFREGNPLCGQTYKSIKKLYYEKQVWNEKKYKETRNFLKEHFIESKNEMKKHWKNTRFCILVYSSDWVTEELCFNELKKQGFEIIYARNLTTENIDTPKYQLSETDSHPNEKAWELLTPLIAKKLNL